MPVSYDTCTDEGVAVYRPPITLPFADLPIAWPFTDQPIALPVTDSPIALAGVPRDIGAETLPHMNASTLWTL